MASLSLETVIGVASGALIPFMREIVQRRASQASRGARDGWSPWHYFAFVGDDDFGRTRRLRQQALDHAEDEWGDPCDRNSEC